MKRSPLDVAIGSEAPTRTTTVLPAPNKSGVSVSYATIWGYLEVYESQFRSASSSSHPSTERGCSGRFRRMTLLPFFKSAADPTCFCLRLGSGRIPSSSNPTFLNLTSFNLVMNLSEKPRALQLSDFLEALLMPCKRCAYRRLQRYRADGGHIREIAAYISCPSANPMPFTNMKCRDDVI